MLLNRLSLYTRNVLRLLVGTPSKSRRRSQAIRSCHTAAEVFEARQFPSGVSLGVIDGHKLKLDSNPATDTNSAANLLELDLGVAKAGDTILAANFIGQGTTVVVVRQPGSNGAPNDGMVHWYYLDGNGIVASHRAFGLAGDSPIAGDWNGDGIKDIGVTRKSGGVGVPNNGMLNWFMCVGPTPLDYTHRQYGFSTDTAVVGNWDGVGGDDLGVVRIDASGNMTWFQNWKGGIYADRTFNFGKRGEQPVAGDWDLDGKDDVAVARSGNGDGQLHVLMDTNGDPNPEHERVFGSAGNKLIVGQWELPTVKLNGNIAATLQQFNGGRWQLAQKAKEIAYAAWGNDVADVPLLRDQPDTALQLGDVLRQAFGGNVMVSNSANSVMADFQRKGFEVGYLGTKPNSRGNYLEVTQLISRQSQNVATPLQDSEGFKYLEDADGRITGALSGRLRDLKGSFTFVVGATGFRVLALSKFDAAFDLKGKGSGKYEIGVLDDVATSGDVSFSGKLGLRLHDTDGDGELSVRELTRNENVLGSLDGRVTYAGRFDTRIGNLVSVSWQGTFSAQIQNQSISRNEQFVYPNYQAIANQMGVGLLAEIRKFDWFRQFESGLTTKLPLVNKSVADLLNRDNFLGENKLGAGLSLLGVSLLNADEGRTTMKQLAHGKLVDLVRFDHRGSKQIWNGDLIDPIRLAQGFIIPGIVSYDLKAILRANVSFEYEVHAGFSSRGLYFTSDTAVGIQGTVEGGLEGRVKVVNYTVLKGSGTLALTLNLSVTVVDQSGDGRVYLHNLKKSPSQYLGGVLDLDLEGRIKAKINTPIKDITVFNESFKIADVVHVEVGSHQSGGIPAQPNSTLILQAERDLAHQIGREDGDGWSVNVRDDSAGRYLAYGPYTTAISDGQHTATFRLQLDNVQADNLRILTIDVFDADTGKVVSSRNIIRKEFQSALTYQDFNLNFTGAASHRFEFRTFWHGNSYAKLDKVTVK